MSASVMSWQEPVPLRGGRLRRVESEAERLRGRLCADGRGRPCELRVLEAAARGKVRLEALGHHAVGRISRLSAP